jgi:hypothetical protein
MTSPSTPRDRVETGAQASGGDDVDDERDAFYAGEADDGDTSASELSDARAALEQAEADMVTAVERARVSPLTGEDIQKVIDAFRAARDRVTQLLRPSYADAARPLVAEKPAAPENAHAGMKRGSDVARRFTGEDTHPAPEERRRDGVATPMDVDDDGAFAGGQGTCTSTFSSARRFKKRIASGAPRRRRVFSFLLSGSRAVMGLPAFAHSAATRDVRDGAERARVFVNRSNYRASDMASR